jgi:hypothetical protein
MACKCPVCEKGTKSIGALFLHLVNTLDSRHELWLDSYCSSNNINLKSIIVNRVKNVKGANDPLTKAMKRDFCT